MYEGGSKKANFDIDDFILAQFKVMTGLQPPPNQTVLNAPHNVEYDMQETSRLIPEAF